MSLEYGLGDPYRLHAPPMGRTALLLGSCPQVYRIYRMCTEGLLTVAEVTRADLDCSGLTGWLNWLAQLLCSQCLEVIWGAQATILKAPSQQVNTSRMDGWPTLAHLEESTL